MQCLSIISRVLLLRFVVHSTVDGAEDDIRQVFYVFALQRDWNEEEAALKWRLLEFQEVASFAYL